MIASRRLVLVVLLLAACSRHGGSGEHVLRLASPGSFEPITPLLESSFSLMLQGQVFDPLITPTEDGWHSRVLSSWHWDSPRELRVQLRPDLRFSDGSPVRMVDVIQSLRAASLEAEVDGDWLKIHATEPIDQSLLKAMLFKKVGSEYLGTGAFAIEEYAPRHIRLRRVRPTARGVSAIELTSVGSPREAFARALSGETNMLLMLDAGERELLDGVPQLRVVRSPGIHALGVYFNRERLSRDERRALLASIDKSEIARAMGSGCTSLGQEAHAPAPPGRPLEILEIPLMPGVHPAALALQRSLGSRGGLIDEVPIDNALARVERRQFDLFLTVGQIWPLGAVSLFWRSTSSRNHLRYSNPDLDRALDLGDAKAVDRAFAEDPPVDFICQIERIMAVDARITNARIGPYDFLESLPDWEFQE